MPFSGTYNAFDGVFAAAIQYAVDYKGQAGVESVAAVLGPAEVTYYWISSFVPPVALVVWDDLVAVVSGSTQNLTQWVGNVLGSAQAVVSPHAGQVSQYFALVAAQQATYYLTDLQAAAPGKRIVYIGFSLGAASMTLAPRITQLPGSTWVMGSPRVGDATWAGSVDVSAFVGVQTTGDPVISLPPTPWAQSGNADALNPWPPLVSYVHPDAGKVVDVNGEITSPYTTMPLSEVLATLAIGSWALSHRQWVYAANSRASLPMCIPPGFGGYQNADQLDEVVSSLWPSVLWPWACQGSAPARPVISEVGTMPCLVTLLLRSTVSPPIGWAETWYWSGSNPQDVLNTWTGGATGVANGSLLGARQALLATTAEIYAIRVSAVPSTYGSPSPKTSVLRRLSPALAGPTTNGPADYCGVSIAFNLLSTASPAKRQVHMRGIPDAWVSNDNLTAVGQLAVNTLILGGLVPVGTSTGVSGSRFGYIFNLFNNGAGIYYLDRGVTVYPVSGTSKADQGLVTVNFVSGSPVSVPAGAPVIIGGSKSFPLLNGSWQAVGNAAPNTVVLSGSQWMSPPPQLQATLRMPSKSIDTTAPQVSVVGVRTRDTGRPTLLPHGRRSARIRHR